MSLKVYEQSDAVKAMAPDWTLAADLLGGTRAMRAKGKTYLPKWPKEEEADYLLRLNSSVLFPAYRRTVQTLAGKPFSKPITFGEDVPARIMQWTQNIDMQGRNADAFASTVFERALGYGMAGILVEYPRATNVRTQAQEAAAGLRPYWVQIDPWQILGWRAEIVNGSWKLTMLRLLETVDDEDGEFGTVERSQVRVLTPGSWATYRQPEEGAAEYVLYEQGFTSLQDIPFVPIYGGRTGFMTAVPPLLEVAYMNVEHWQSASDQRNILHVARVPMLAVTGVEDDEWKLTVGTSSATKLPANADMKFVEHSGAAIGAGKDDLDALEERMRQAGAELLVLAPGRVTATQVITENALGMCVLQQITQTFEDALDQALQFSADWVGEASGGHVSVFNDYGAATLLEASAQLLLQSNQAGKISDETYHGELQRRGILSADLSWDDERVRLEEQGPALGEMSSVLTGTGSEQSPSGVLAFGAPPAPSTSEAPFDMEALISAIESIQAPVVNVAPAAITVEAPQISLPQITVTVPEQPAPIVNVTPSPVNVSSPPVNVTIEKGGAIKFTEDSDGNITGATMQ